jgi:hypothetical protein
MQNPSKNGEMSILKKKRNSKNLVLKSLEKRTFKISRRWEDNTKMEHRDIGYQTGSYVELDHDYVQ